MDGLLGPILKSSKGKDSPDILGEQGNQAGNKLADSSFVDAYQQSVEAYSAAKSGIGVPSTAANIVEKPIDSADVEIDLEYKTLNGGTQLILGGDEPTTDGVNEFAKSQGIDAQLLNLLMQERPADDHQINAQVNLTAEGIIFSPSPSVEGTKSHVAEHIGRTGNESMSGDGLKQVSSVIINQSISSSKDAIADAPAKVVQPILQVPASQARVTELDDLKLAVRSDSRGSEMDFKNRINSEQSHQLTDAVKNSVLAGTDNAKRRPSADLSKLPESATTVGLKSTLSVNLIDAQDSQQKSPLNQKQLPDQLLSYQAVALKPVQKSPMDPLNSPIETPKNLSSPFMNTRPKASDGVPDTQKVNKAAEFRLLTKAMIEAQRPDSILERPRLKLPAIDLLDSNVTVARPASSDMSAAAVTKALAPGEHGSTLLAQLAAADAKANSAQKASGSENTQFGDRPLLTRQEQYIDISRRMSEALGQRLSAQIQKGAWQVELDLHPKSLGRIEIQLEMKNGELEAYFNASKAVTRDLLQDGMPRLKQELDQHGIETAYVGLGAGNQSKDDEKSTPSDVLADAAKDTTEEANDTQSVVRSAKLSDDGLDISV